MPANQPPPTTLSHQRLTLTKLRRKSILNACRTARPLPQAPPCRTFGVVGSSESRGRTFEPDGFFRPSEWQEQEEHEQGYGLRDGRSRVRTRRDFRMHATYRSTVVHKHDERFQRQAVMASSRSALCVILLICVATRRRRNIDKRGALPIL